jgi:hypothetical protein
MVEKKKKAQVKFQEEAHMQGGKRVPLPAGRVYGTGLPPKTIKKK